METMKRAEAIKLGVMYYFTNKLCRHGHLDKRRTKTGQCTECERVRQRSEEQKEYHRKLKATPKYRKMASKYRKSSQGSVMCREQSRATHLKRTYGLTLEGYATMQRVQNYQCGICSGSLLDTCFVDHNHNTGKVRNLLCQHCNSMIGFARDDITVLEAAIKYLIYHNG